MDRRKFLKSTCTLGLGIAGTAVLLDSCKKNSTNSASPQGPTVNFQIDMNQVGYTSLKTMGNAISANGVLIVNTGNGGYTAIAQTCTHNGCKVGYNKSGNNFLCPCHNGMFDINGKVMAGPPPAPLKKYTVTNNSDVLTIAG
jgi:cytochrome b6-f complex iron-sulfur subunit